TVRGVVSIASSITTSLQAGSPLHIGGGGGLFWQSPTLTKQVESPLLGSPLGYRAWHSAASLICSTMVCVVGAAFGVHAAVPIGLMSVPSKGMFDGLPSGRSKSK